MLPTILSSETCIDEIHAAGLIRNSSYVNGRWVQQGTTFPVLNPANKQTLDDVHGADTLVAEQAVVAANNALPKWLALSADQRAALLIEWFNLLIKNKKLLAKLLTLEQGKPLAEASSEISYGASYIEWFAHEGKRICGDAMISPSNSNQMIMVLKQGIGVVGAITPWNFPCAMIARKAAAALAAGCTFIVKPAPETPLTALAMAELSERAGIPAGVFNVLVTDEAKCVGKILTEHRGIAKFTFTGSTEVGKTLAKQCAGTVKKISMELGGNAPFIVFDDADIDRAVQGAILSKFRNAGQTCVCSNRFFIHEKISDQFVEKLIAATEQLILGNGLSAAVDIGPLINNKAVEKTNERVASAIAQGAVIAYQAALPKELADNRLAREGFYPPTILTQVTNDMEIAQYELFAPVVCIITFSDENSVIAKANATDYGLAAYLYSTDFSRTLRVSRALEFGMIAINDGVISNVAAPFGGIKQSGFGREGSMYGLDDYLTLKYLSVPQT